MDSSGNIAFLCPACQREIVLSEAVTGEPYRCPLCQQSGVVPAVPSTQQNPPTEEMPPAEAGNQLPSAAKASGQSLAGGTGHPGSRVFTIVAGVANVLYFIIMIDGLLDPEVGETDVSVAFFDIVFIALMIWNLIVLFGFMPSGRRLLMACDLVIFVAMGLLTIIGQPTEPYAIAGGLMLIALGLLSYLGLAVRQEDSWIALRIERSRLEEMEKVMRLRKQVEGDELSKGN